MLILRREGGRRDTALRTPTLRSMRRGGAGDGLCVVRGVGGAHDEEEEEGGRRLGGSPYTRIEKKEEEVLLWTGRWRICTGRCDVGAVNACLPRRLV